MKVKLCKQANNMFVNNVTCLKQQQQPLAIHYDRDHSHCIVSSNVLVGRGGAIRNNNTFE